MLQATPELTTAETQPATEPTRDFDLRRIERAVRDILLALGEDPDRDGLKDTPRRVAKSFRELCEGLRQDPAVHLSRQFEHPTGPSGDLVLVRNIGFHSLCEHHLLPFSGRAHVAYLPAGGRVVGLSKLARTVEVYARRPQMQERLCAQVADAMAEHLDPLGVAVVVEASHSCMTMRGASKPEADMLTTAFRGVFEGDLARQGQLLSLLGGAR